MSRSREKRVLQVVATDATFERRTVRGAECWVGRCLHCNRKLVVGLDGRTTATIEHCVPRNHGGTDEPRNLALACEPCNRQKGWRHDHRRSDHPRTREVIDALVERRLERWREPGEEPGA